MTITGKSDLFVANTIGSVAKRQGGVDVQSVRYVVTHPTQISPVERGSRGARQWFFGNCIAVLINPETGNLIQVKSITPKGYKGGSQ